MAEKKVLIPLPNPSKEMVTIYSQQNANLWNKLVGGIPADSTAVDVAGIVADFNELLGILRTLNNR